MVFLQKKSGFPKVPGLLIGHGVKATDEESTLQHLDMGGTIDQ